MAHRKSNPTATRMLAARHEALLLKLTALHAQITAVATKRPQTPVCAHTTSVAEDLLRAALPFLAKGERLPMAAPDHGGLLTQLGQAMACMDHWEASRLRWDEQQKAYFWQVKGPLPVRRLRPKLVGQGSRPALGCVALMFGHGATAPCWGPVPPSEKKPAP